MLIDYDLVADLYDLYVTADYDVPFFVAEVTRTKGAVLELTAGTGRLSLPLIEAGARLTCVDASRGMLDMLARKLAERGLRAELRRAEASRMELSERFELALLPFQSFMEILDEDDQRAALAAVFACLEPGGRFICTMHNPAVRRRQVDGMLRLVGQFAAPEGTLVVSGVEQGGNPVVARLQFFELFGADGRMLWKRLLPMRFAFVEKETFERMAREVGFRIANLYGNYDRSPFDPASSPVMIWMLERQA
jgi:ubiquinone/menaquinone biosynthesis C-methylase UbiE